MAAYIAATVKIEDPDRFAAYRKLIAGLSESFGGEPIVQGPVVELLEGDGVVWERVVVTRSPSAEAARRYIESADIRPPDRNAWVLRRSSCVYWLSEPANV